MQGVYVPGDLSEEAPFTEETTTTLGRVDSVMVRLGAHWGPRPGPASPPAALTPTLFDLSV